MEKEKTEDIKNLASREKIVSEYFISVLQYAYKNSVKIKNNYNFKNGLDLSSPFLKLWKKDGADKSAPYMK